MFDSIALLFGCCSCVVAIFGEVSGDSDVVDMDVVDSGVADDDDDDDDDTVSSGIILDVADISCDAGVLIDVFSCTSFDTERRLLFEEDDGVSSTGGDVSFPTSASGNGSGRFDSSGNVSESGLTLRS